MFKKLFAIIALLFTTLSFSGCAPEVTNELPRVGIIIENATITAGDVQAIVSADITNRAEGTVTLTGAKSSAAGETQLLDGIEVLTEGVEIHVGQTIELRESGKYLVLLQLSKPITYGDKVNVTFEFAGAEAQTIQVTAK